MNNIHKPQITNGQESRPPNSPAFSAACGRALGCALLMLSAVPSFAGPQKTPNNGNSPTVRPNSVVWGAPKASPINQGSVVSTGSTTGNANIALGHKFSADLQQLSAPNNGPARSSGNNMVTVIVQYRQMPGSGHLRAMRDDGAFIGSKLHTIRAVTMRVPVSMLAALEKNPNVAYVTPDRPVSMSASNEDYVTAIEEDVAAAQFAQDGTGVGVAIIDSGVADHSDLHNATGASRVVYSQSFVAGDNTTSDQFGHGTHVAGLVGGSGVSSGLSNGYLAKYAGVAPNVNIINLRVLDQNGSGTDSQVIAAIQQAIALKDTYNIRVINMSLGRPVFESYTLDPVCQAVEAA